MVALVSGYATAKQPAPKLFKLLEPAILKQADTYGAEAVSKVAWSYSKLHSGTELLFRRLSSRATAVGIDGFDHSQLALLLAAVARSSPSVLEARSLFEATAKPFTVSAHSYFWPTAGGMGKGGGVHVIIANRASELGHSRIPFTIPKDEVDFKAMRCVVHVRRLVVGVVKTGIIVLSTR